MRMGFPGIMSPSLQRGKFVPSDINGIFFWQDADDSSTISESSGSVSQWNDKSGNGFNTTQGTGSAQPTTSATSLNNRNVLDFDGGDHLIMPSGTFTVTNGANTTFCVAKRNSEDGSVNIMGMAEGATRNFFILYSATDGLVAFKNRTGIIGSVNSADNTNTDFQIITCRRSGTTQGISVNGETEITNSNGQDAASVDAAFIGQSGVTGELLIGSIAEIIMYNRSLSVSEIIEINEYLSAKWAIALV